MSVLVINLDRDTERLATFLQTNGHVADIVRFPAVDGRLVDRNALMQRGMIGPELSYGAGILGCALSHLELWRRAVASNASTTIVEDDAILARDFTPAHVALLAILPQDWGIVLWGWNFDRAVWAEIPEGVARSVVQFDQDDLRNNLQAFRRQLVPHAPIRLRHCFGSLAYTVSPHGAQTLLDTCLPLTDRFIGFPGFRIGVANDGIDCLMNLAYPRMKAYVCMPPLAVSENRAEHSRTVPDFVPSKVAPRPR
jgi:GR25 family glycosyltransferase involved in LPS biosynthesis